jgi:hypothetical protein
MLVDCVVGLGERNCLTFCGILADVVLWFCEKVVALWKR